MSAAFTSFSFFTDTSEESHALLNPVLLKYLVLSTAGYHLATFIGALVILEIFSYYNRKKNILKRVFDTQLRNRRKTLFKNRYKKLRIIDKGLHKGRGVYTYRKRRSNA